MTPPEPPGSIPSGPAVGEDVLYAPVLERQAEHGLVVCHYGTGGRAVRASAAGLGRRPVFAGGPGAGHHLRSHVGDLSYRLLM